MIDPRVDAVRGDLADVRIAARVFAPHYAAAVLRSAVQRAPVRATPDGDVLSEILAGEPFEVLEQAHGHAWGISPVDGAVGYVDRGALAPFRAMTYRDLGPPDFVTVAEALADAATPVVDGGRSRAGVDAAGLVFMALASTGFRAPRFLDLQAAGLGHPIADGAPLLRGDLLFSGSGVAIATDVAHVIYAAADRVTRAAWAAIGPITIRRRLP